MAITAASGAASARVEARRPSWADMERHYPDAGIKTPLLYDQMIGGRFSGLYKHGAYQNTCAVRMSYALNRSGLKLGPPPSTGGSMQGRDGYVYWIRVSDLKPYLIKRFKGADEELSLPLIPASLAGNIDAMRPLFAERKRLAKAWLDSKLKNRNGIVVFEVSGWGDASGHFTLWNGTTKKLAYAETHDDPESNRYYFLAHQSAGSRETGSGGRREVLGVEMTVQFFITFVLMIYTSLASSAELCPPTSLNMDWSAECFEGKDGFRRVRQDYIKNLKLNNHGMTTILIAMPRELVAVNREGKVVVPGIRHTGDFDYPRADLGIGRFYSDADTTGKRTQCGYFASGSFQIIVPARFDHCKPFRESQALACTGCTSYCSELDCQNSVLVGGQGTIIGKNGAIRKTFLLPSLETVCRRPELVRISKLDTGADMLRCMGGSGDLFNER